MNKTKVIGAILGVVLFVAAIAGLTYAAISWTSDDINRTVSTKCFDVYYEKGADLVGELIPTNHYTNGLSTTVKMSINENCNINAKGKIYLNTSNLTSSNLYREGLLNYEVLIDDSYTGIHGNITGSGEIELDVGELSKGSGASTSYTVYVWIDNDLVNNSDYNSVYYGNIRVEAIQYNNK